jgi:hypothetical protein
MLERFPRDLLIGRIHSFKEMFRRNVSIESERNFSLSQSNWYFKDSWQLNCLFVVSVQKNEFNSSSMNGAIVLLEDVDRSRRSSFSSLDRSFGKSSVCRTADLQVLTLHNDLSSPLCSLTSPSVRLSFRTDEDSQRLTNREEMSPRRSEEAFIHSFKPSNTDSLPRCHSLDRKEYNPCSSSPFTERTIGPFR